MSKTVEIVVQVDVDDNATPEQVAEEFRTATDSWTQDSKKNLRPNVLGPSPKISVRTPDRSGGLMPGILWEKVTC